MNGKKLKNNICLEWLNKAEFQNINGRLKIKKIWMDIIYVIIYLIVVYKCQNNGKIINIKIQK